MGNFPPQSKILTRNQFSEFDQKSLFSKWSKLPAAGENVDQKSLLFWTNSDFHGCALYSSLSGSPEFNVFCSILAELF